MTGSKTRSARRISGISAAVLTAGVAGALAVPSTASAATSQTSFVGHCSIVGRDTADLRHSYFRGQGLCFGSLNGGRAAAHHVVEVIREHGTTTPDYFGAPAVHGASQGVGTLIFGDTRCTKLNPCRVLHFSIQESLTQFTVEGAVDGLASGTAVPTTDGQIRLSTSTSGTLVG